MAAVFSLDVPVLLRRTLQVGHDVSRGAVWRATTASLWLDLARGRLRLDRLSRNGGGSTFFPWASPI
uniref:hypothetical protein n=1 Tax=Reyranella sp. TaxID=1929291 RepID=UPI00263A35E2